VSERLSTTDWAIRPTKGTAMAAEDAARWALIVAEDGYETQVEPVDVEAWREAGCL